MLDTPRITETAAQPAAIIRLTIPPAPNLWESYLAGPESGPDSAAWRTELNRPLAG